MQIYEPIFICLLFESWGFFEPSIEQKSSYLVDFAATLSLYKHRQVFLECPLCFTVSTYHLEYFIPNSLVLALLQD